MKSLILLLTLLFSFNSYSDESITEGHIRQLKGFANQGHAGAQEILGAIYMKGESGVSHDHEKAVYWYEKSANQGNAKAQRKLGGMYFFGYGVSRDFEKAAYWYEKSANQGNIGAQYDLGMMYVGGHGVSRDYVEAYKWLLLSRSIVRTLKYKNVIFLEERMTEEEKLEARDLALKLSKKISDK